MRAAVAIAVAVALAGCGGSRPTAGPAPEPSAADVPLEPQQPADADEAANSGRSLSGVYVLATPSPPETAATWTFAADGTYSRSRTFGRAERRDAGTYVVDTAGRLVLYVEQQGDSRLAWAERVTFALGGDPATAVVVTTSEGRAETLVRTGDAPPTR